LSKPTAASISKVRSPTVSPFVKTAKTTASASSSPARGGFAAPKATLKPRVGLAPTKTKEAAADNNQSSNGTAKVAAVVTATSIAVADLRVEAETSALHDDESEAVGHQDDEPEANDHNPESSEYLDGSYGQGQVEEPEEMSQNLEDEGVSHQVMPEDHEEVAEKGDEIEGLSTVVSPDLHVLEAEPHEVEYELERRLDAKAEAELEPEAEARGELETQADAQVTSADEDIANDAPVEEASHNDTDVGPHPTPASMNQVKEVFAENVVEPPTEAGNDIADIVNLLETMPTVPISQPRPLSIASIPDDAPDIPDEE
jgi:hypothetical protein